MAAPRKTRVLAKTAPAPAAAAPTESASDLVGIDDAVAILKTTRPTFYRWLRAGRIKAMKAGRQWRFYRSDLERFLHGEAPRIETPGDVSGLLAAVTARLAALDVKLPAPSEGTPAVILERVLQLADVLRASDVHLEPPVGGGEGTLRFRIDGVLQPGPAIDARLYPALVDQFKTWASCDLQQKRKPQDGRIMMHIGKDPGDLRVCFVPAVTGEAVTVRLLRRGSLTFNLDALPYAAADLDRLRAATRLPWGIVLITGPTGCGKTTSLYALLRSIDSATKKVITIEDPVEYAFPGMLQLQVAPQLGCTFTTLMRAVLRCDPDVVMIGEIRDAETLQIATQAALTGHLVFTTLHTDDAPTGLTRMRDMGLDPFLISDSVKLIVAQRLVRKLCQECSRPAEPADNERREAARLAREGGIDFDSLPRQFRQPVGCKACGHTGYRWRTVIAETLVSSPAVGAALRAGAPTTELRRLAVQNGMTTIAADGIRRAAEGVTSLAEVLQTAPRLL